MEHHLSHDNGEIIADAIQCGMAALVTDGLFKNGLGMVAFMIKGDDMINQEVHVNTSLGYSVDQSSLWSKLAGCYGVVHTRRAVC